MDRETFKALASETRLDVLHALDNRRMTGSELARELELNKATVHEHLQILGATGLVAKLDEGRKWLYWELTWEGKKLLHPETGTTFNVLLGLSALAGGGGLIALGRALGWWLADHVAPAGDSGQQEAALAPENADDADQSSSTEAMDGSDSSEMVLPNDAMDGGFFDDGGWIFLALLATTVLMVGLAVWLRRRK